MDAFVRLVQEARKAGQFRDGLIREMHSRYVPVPRDVSARHYSTRGQAGTRDLAYSVVINPVWRVSREGTGASVKPRKRRCGNASRVKRYGLSKEAMTVLRLVIDYRRREVVRATDELQASVGRLRKETPEEKAVKLNKLYDAEAWRGMIPARETRYSERGASGIPGVRGLAAKVSMRDVRKPTALLLPLLTVGVATHPGASDENYSEAILYVRQHPLASTVRVKLPASHGAYRSTIVPVSDYTALARERRGEARQVRHVATAAMVPEVQRLALAGKLDYLGDAIQ